MATKTTKPKLRHNKKRNTAFLYEVLVRELTKSIIEEDKNKKKNILSIMKKHFGKSALLKKELSLYNELVNTTDLKPRVAERMIYEVKAKHKKLDKKRIFLEQSIVISKINKAVSKDAFSNFVPNYKNIATIYQIFNNEDGTEISTKEKILLEETLLEKLSSSFDTNHVKNSMKPIDNLVYNSFVKSFNQAYGSLHEEQTRLLNTYISSFNNNGLELKIYLNEELARLKKEIKESQKREEIKNDTEMLEKSESVLNILESFKEVAIDEKMLRKVLQIQELIREITV